MEQPTPMNMPEVPAGSMPKNTEPGSQSNTQIPEVDKKMKSMNKTTKWIVLSLVLAVLLLVIIIIALLLTSMNNLGTPTTQSDNSNNNSNGSNSTSYPIVSSPVSNSSNSSANSIPDTKTVYNSSPINISGTDYYSFDNCDNTISVCFHYLLSADMVPDFPVLTSAVDGQSYLIAGDTAPSPAGNAAGNEYFLLTTNVDIMVLANYVDVEPDVSDATATNYAFSSCAQPAPPCVTYFISHDSSIPVLATLVANDQVAISGNLTSEGAAAGTQYYKFDNNIVIVKQ